MSTPPASENVEICGHEPSVTGADGRYSHQHDHELSLRQQSEQEQLSRMQELPPEGNIGHVPGQDSGQVHPWSHQEQPFQQDVVLQLQAAAETITAVNGSMHSTMAEYLAHVTAAASGDAFGHGYPGDNVQMQIPMSELMAHVAPGDGELTATEGIGGMVGVQMLQPTEQLQYGGPPEIDDQAAPEQLLPGDMRLQMQGGAEGQGLQIPLPPLRALPAAKECPICHLWKPGSEFLKISRSADGLAHKCKACAMKAADGPTRDEKPCSKCKEMKSKDAFCINKYMADGMQSQCKVCAKAGRKKVSGPQVSEKACKSCSISRPASEFHQDKRNPDGLHMHCKICRKRKGAPSAEEEVVTEKACARCQLVKGASSFYVDRQSQSGLEDQCKECRRANRRLVTEVTVNDKPCAKCHTTKAAGEFYHDKRAGDGLQSYCKVCMKLRSEHTEDQPNVRKRRIPPPILPRDVTAQELLEVLAGAQEPHYLHQDILLHHHGAGGVSSVEDVQIPMSELMAQEDPPDDPPPIVDGIGEDVKVD